ncbi:DUF885 domain-containing protein [Ferrimonas balearica]|uniref:DUF885 domain-containing protein n=1 Tax=Ferrimonas balearica TaxID=44012 RepID=UPI001C993F69|nr:DUF885 domain-containing protein [Ferrimonas balearica]MBY5921149.1 DUF885 domain-containing protein [Ferrimonas balearica]MBY5996166.1 DUF885 domain-containing protein [Ferrimonas balearica]
MKTTLSALAVVTALGLVGCSPASAPSEETKPSESQVAAVSVSEQYQALAEQYFQDLIALNPVMATYVGEHRYNDQLANNLADDYLKARHELNTRYLKRLMALDWDQLNDEDRLSAQVLRYELEMALVDETYPSRFLPMNQFYSRVISFVQLGSGESAQPFNTVEDYDNFIGRINDFAGWISSAIARMEEGSESNVVLPRVLVQRIIPQLQAQLDTPLAESPFYGPLATLPEGLSETEAEALTERYELALTDTLYPALVELHGYFQNTYLNKARGTHGWGALPNGKAWYQHLANMHTTTTMPVEEIHQLGLSEVARILDEMDGVREQVGFKGDLAAFFEYLGSDEQFFFTDKQGLIDGYMGLKDEINAVLPKYFDVMPKADYVVKAVEPFRERSAAGASYDAPAPDGSRPGVFYINTYNLKAQPKWGMTTLSLHEAAPGHHFQIAIKQELDGVASFQRFGGYTAFEEGWALYAEQLGIEMGLFSDPYQYFGKLSDEMLRAMRLVVDTGLHAKGWTREQAIQYMLDNSPMAESDVTAEVERYMAIPGQALSYKVGQLTILALRAEAEAALGERFDLRAFHNQVLTSGSLPMAVLQEKIRHWIDAQA